MNHARAETTMEMMPSKKKMLRQEVRVELISPIARNPEAINPPMAPASVACSTRISERAKQCDKGTNSVHEDGDSEYQLGASVETREQVRASRHDTTLKGSKYDSNCQKGAKVVDESGAKGDETETEDKEGTVPASDGIAEAFESSSHPDPGANKLHGDLRRDFTENVGNVKDRQSDCTKA